MFYNLHNIFEMDLFHMLVVSAFSLRLLKGEQDSTHIFELEEWATVWKYKVKLGMAISFSLITYSLTNVKKEGA